MNNIDLTKKYSDMSDIGNMINEIPTIAQTENLPNKFTHKNSQNSFIQNNLDIIYQQNYNSNEYK